MSPADYDGFAAAYTAQNDTSLFNAHYNRPELVRMAGEIRGQRILDAGCGAGQIMSDLLLRGARVSGFDVSPAMIEIARGRLGDEVDLRVADLGEPLPYSDNAFDVVIASLALHYVEDWASTLAELRRVLVPSGRLLVSIIHPTVYAVVYPEADYFTLTQYSEDYTFGDQKVWMTYWHRPLQAVINSFIGGGFAIRAVTEPPPAPDTPRELLPNQDGRSFICFLFFDLQAP
ncbi:MAG: class I SAM-dependent methyltransferase [Actinobacteria bacterium]|nr:class I SAM-dependent methyltransferase [Actinomycetota bacterium]